MVINILRTGELRRLRKVLSHRRPLSERMGGGSNIAPLLEAFDDSNHSSVSSTLDRFMTFTTLIPQSME
jgi:hypothetical protein